MDTQCSRVGMADRIMESMVLPAAKAWATDRGLPIESEYDICCNAYRSIVPYLEVLYFLEEKEGEMKREIEEIEEKYQPLNALLSTLEVLKRDLDGCEKKFVKLESLRKKLGEKLEDANVELLGDALINVQSELGKLYFELKVVPALVDEYARVYRKYPSREVADLIISESQTGGWKMWYKSQPEYSDDLKDAVSLYYRIGNSPMRKKICETIMGSCPSFEPSQFNLDLSKLDGRFSK